MHNGIRHHWLLFAFFRAAVLVWGTQNRTSPRCMGILPKDNSRRFIPLSLVCHHGWGAVHRIVLLELRIFPKHNSRIPPPLSLVIHQGLRGLHLLWPGLRGLLILRFHPSPPGRRGVHTSRRRSFRSCTSKPSSLSLARPGF